MSAPLLIITMAWMEDDEWADLASEIPAFEEPFIQKFVSGRQALIAEEKKQRSGMTLFH